LKIHWDKIEDWNSKNRQTKARERREIMNKTESPKNSTMKKKYVLSRTKRNNLTSSRSVLNGIETGEVNLDSNIE
jgi:hypothetical protein